MDTLEPTPMRQRSQRTTIGVRLGLMAIGTFLLLSNWFNLGIFFVLGLGLIFLTWGVLSRTAGLLIPGGILSGFGTGIVLVEGPLLRLNDNLEGGVFLLSFALGWFSIVVLSRLLTREPQWWAAIPGAIMGTIGTAILLGGVWLDALEMVSDWWPLGLVGLGAWLLVRHRTASNHPNS